MPRSANQFKKDGWNGVDKKCYSLKAEDLISATGYGDSTPVYPRIMQYTVGMPARYDGVILDENLAPLFRSIQPNDFFVSKNNDPALGLLAFELWFPDVPNALVGGYVQRFTPKDNVTGVFNPTTMGDSFWQRTKKEDYPCITVQEAAEAGRLVDCKPDAMEPKPLTRAFCNATAARLSDAISQYARKIQSNAQPFPSTRYPPANTGYVCLWDCGYEGGSGGGPLHIGLDEEERMKLVGMGESWLKECWNWAGLKEGQIGRYFFSMCLVCADFDFLLRVCADFDFFCVCRMCYVDPAEEEAYAAGTRDPFSSTKGATEADFAGTYVQEVCCELIKESDKGWIDFCEKGGAALPWAMGACMDTIFDKLRRKNSGGDGWVASTMFQHFPEQGKAEYGRPYKCSRVQVQSSGNEVVDRVRSSLSFNDIQVWSQIVFEHMVKVAAEFQACCAGVKEQGSPQVAEQ